MKKINMKKALLGISLAAIVGVGGTFAYLTSVTETATNTFTMGTGITGETDEPNWDPEQATNFVPGKVIAKDPVVVNTSVEGTTSAYVGMKISYKVKDESGNYVDSSYEELDQFINILNDDNPGFNTTDWTLAEGNTIAYYNGTLAAQSSTNPLFSAVEIDKLALTPAQVLSGETAAPQFNKSFYEVKDESGKVEYTYTTYTMKDFQIEVQGYLVQNDGFDSAQEALSAAFPEVFTAEVIA